MREHAERSCTPFANVRALLHSASERRVNRLGTSGKKSLSSTLHKLRNCWASASTEFLVEDFEKAETAEAERLLLGIGSGSAGFCTNFQGMGRPGRSESTEGEQGSRERLRCSLSGPCGLWDATARAEHAPNPADTSVSATQILAGLSSRLP